MLSAVAERLLIRWLISLYLYERRRQRLERDALRRARDRVENIVDGHAEPHR